MNGLPLPTAAFLLKHLRLSEYSFDIATPPISLAATARLTVEMDTPKANAAADWLCPLL